MKRREDRNSGVDCEGDAGARLSGLTVVPGSAHFGAGASWERPCSAGYSHYPQNSTAWWSGFAAKSIVALDIVAFQPRVSSRTTPIVVMRPQVAAAWRLRMAPGGLAWMQSGLMDS